MILKNQKGSVLVEFAIVLPILMVLIYAVQDLATYVSYSKKIEKITKNTVNLPTKLKQIYDAENPTNLSNYDHIDAKNMLLAIINASKLIFYTYSNDITKNNFPKLVLCWTLVESYKEGNNYRITIPWRVFIKLTSDAIVTNKILFRAEHIDVEKNLTYNKTSEKFENYNSSVDFYKLEKLRYKIPEGEGYLLVLDVFDYNIQNKKLCFSNLYPDDFFKFHKTAYQFVRMFQVTKSISEDIREVEYEN